MPAGNIADIAYAVQTAQGSPATPPTVRSPVTGGGLGPNRSVIDIEETTDSRLRNRSVVAYVDVAGSPEIACRADDIGAWLFGALGSEGVGGVGDPFTHVIVNAGSLPYMTFWRSLGGLIWEEFDDCKIQQLVITSETGQPMKAVATVIGLNPVYHDEAGYASVVAIDFTDEDPFMHYDGSGVFLVDGAPVSCIEKIVLTINNNSAIQRGDSLGGCAITEGMLDITAELTHSIEDADLYNAFHYGDASPTDGDGPSTTPLELAAGFDFSWIRPGSPTRSLEIEAPRVTLQTLAGYEPNTNGDPLKDTQTYKVYQPSVGNGITATVLNGQGPYSPAS
jgi:hypothetical protein